MEIRLLPNRRSYFPRAVSKDRQMHRRNKHEGVCNPWVIRDTYIRKRIKIADGIEIWKRVKMWDITNVSGMALLQNNIFNWLLSLPCNLKFSKLREYDSVVSAKVKPILRTSEQPRNVILPGKKFSKSLTRRVAHLYIFLTEEHFTDCRLEVKPYRYWVFYADTLS